MVKNGISVQTQLAEGLPLIRGDRVQLQQVILNLIINAVEAMSDVGEGARELLISTARPSRTACSSRCGIRARAWLRRAFERVFDAFYTTKPGGLGMGLSICRSIIEAHGGRLWATANVPQGAIFQFTLPARPDSEQEKTRTIGLHSRTAELHANRDENHQDRIVLHGTSRRAAGTH